MKNHLINRAKVLLNRSKEYITEPITIKQLEKELREMSLKKMYYLIIDALITQCAILQKQEVEEKNILFANKLRDDVQLRLNFVIEILAANCELDL